MRFGSLRFLPLFVALLVVTACQSEEEKLAEHLSRADTYLEEEQYPEAIIEYKSALQIDPNSGAAHWGLAQSHVKNDEAREGFWELRETVRLDEGNVAAKLQFGQLSIIAGEPEEARKQGEEVLAIEPENIRAFIVVGQAEEALKKRKAAREAYEQAVELGPGSDDYPDALRFLAVFHNRGTNRDAAEPLFRKLTEVQPSFPNYVALAGFVLQGGDPDGEAEQLYRKAVEVAELDEMASAYGVLAGHFYRMDRFDDAVAVLEQGIEELDDPLDLIYLLARFYNARGENEKADALVEEATLKKPDEVRPFMILSTYRGRRDDLPGALAAIEKALALEPEHEGAILRKAELLVDMGFRNENDEGIAEGQALVDAILEANPAHPSALVVGAKIHLAQANPQEAVVKLHVALDARPDWPQAHFLLGSALGLQGDRIAARTELARALELDAGLIEARKVLAQIHHRLGEHEFAVEEGRRFLTERPNDNSTRIVVAQSLVNLGRRTEALRELEKVDVADRDPKVLFALGQINMVMGRFDVARENIEAAEKLIPTNPDVLRSLMALDSRENRFDESIARIDAAAEAAPDDGRIQQLKGIVALSRGRGDEAEESFKKAIELSPSDLSGYERLASFYGRTGRSQQAIDTYEKAVEVRPQRAQLYYMLGVLYEFTGQMETAIESYEEAVRRGPELGEAKNNLAYIYADAEQNLDRALDLAQEARALLPDNANAADTMGWVLYKRGIPSAAISFLKEAESGIEKGAANLGVVRHHLALAYEANDEPQEALATVERALSDLDSGIADAREKNRQIDPEPSWATDLRAMRERLKKGLQS